MIALPQLRTITRKSGFTIVELLIVIIVIGILAAITIGVYSGMQNRTSDNTVQTDIANIKRKLELARVDLGHYPQSLAELNGPALHRLSKAAYDVNNNNVYYITDTANDTFALGLRSKSGKGFILTNSGLQENVSISANATATAIGVVWGAAGTFARQGFTFSTQTWSPSWEWTA